MAPDALTLLEVALLGVVILTAVCLACYFNCRRLREFWKRANELDALDALEFERMLGPLDRGASRSPSPRPSAIAHPVNTSASFSSRGQHNNSRRPRDTEPDANSDYNQELGKDDERISSESSRRVVRIVIEKPPSYAEAVDCEDSTA